MQPKKYLIVQGATSYTSMNGVYREAGYYAGKRIYEHIEGGWWIFWSSASTRWKIHNGPTDTGSYHNRTNNDVRGAYTPNFGGATGDVVVADYNGLVTQTQGTYEIKTTQDEIDEANETINLIPEVSSIIPARQRKGL